MARECFAFHDDELLKRVEQVAAICTKPAHVVNGIYLLRESGVPVEVLHSLDFAETLLPYLPFKTTAKSLKNLFLRRSNMR